MSKEIHIRAGELFLEQEQNFMLSVRGDYILSFTIQYHPRFTQSKEDLLELKDAWDRALLNLPVGTIVCKSDVFEKSYYDSSTMPQTNYIQQATAKHFSRREYIKHSGYLFFVFTKNNILKNNQIKNPFVFPKLKTFATNDAELKVFRDKVDGCVTLLQKSDKLDITPLEADEAILFSEKWLCGFHSQMATDLEFEKNKLHAAGQRIGMFSITNEQSFPESLEPIERDSLMSSSMNEFVFYRGLFDDLGITLNCSHVVNNIIMVDNSKSHIDAMHLREDALYKMRKFGHDNALASERLKGYLEDMRNPENANLKFVRGNTSVIFMADNDEEFQILSNSISTIIDQTRIGYYVPTGERLKNLYLNTLFVNTPLLDNKSCYLVDQQVATSMFIANGAYGEDEEGLYFQDRYTNKPILFDYWDEAKKRLVSRNFGVIAKTGKGKSVLCEWILSGLIDSQEVVVVIIDLGNSYEKMSKLYPPEDVAFFRYKEGVPLGLNPFELEDNETVGELKVEQVAEIIWVLIKKTGVPSENERTSMRAIIETYFLVMLRDNKRDQLCWQTFYEFIKKQGKELLKNLEIDPKYFDLTEFIHAGRDFSPTGIYRHIFEKSPNAPKNSFGRKKLIIFELDEIRENNLLLTVMLQIISETISQVIWKDKSTRGCVFFDEFAKSLQFPGVKERVAFYAQAIRKQEGMLGIVLQNADQLPEDSLSASTFGNLETIVSFPTKDEIALDNLAKRKTMSLHDRCLIKSMGHNFSGERKYTEFHIKRGDDFSQVFRLELPAEVLLAFETEGTRAEAMLKRYDELGSMQHVIEEYLHKTPVPEFDFETEEDEEN